MAKNNNQGALLLGALLVLLFLFRQGKGALGLPFYPGPDIPDYLFPGPPSFV